MDGPMLVDEAREAQPVEGVVLVEPGIAAEPKGSMCAVVSPTPRHHSVPSAVMVSPTCPYPDLPLSEGKYGDIVNESRTPGVHDSFFQTMTPSDSLVAPVYTIVNLFSIVSIDGLRQITLKGSNDGIGWAPDGLDEEPAGRLHARSYQLEICDVPSGERAHVIINSEDRHALKVFCEERVAMAFGHSFAEGKRCIESHPDADLNREILGPF